MSPLELKRLSVLCLIIRLLVLCWPQFTVCQVICQIVPVRPLHQCTPIIRQPLFMTRPIAGRSLSQFSPIIRWPLFMLCPIAGWSFSQFRPIIRWPLFMTQPCAGCPLFQFSPVIRWPLQLTGPVTSGQPSWPVSPSDPTSSRADRVQWRVLPHGHLHSLGLGRGRGWGGHGGLGCLATPHQLLQVSKCHMLRVRVAVL